MKKKVERDTAAPSFSDLPAHWRSQAAALRRLGIEGNARTLECCAEDFEEAHQRDNEELLTLTEAADVTGYSADHLGRLVRDGKVPNLGRPNAPRVRHADLPRKRGALPSPRATSNISRAEIARAVIKRRAGGAR